MQRLNDKIGVDSDFKIDDRQLKKKVRRKEESEVFIIEKAKKSVVV